MNASMWPSGESAGEVAESAQYVSCVYSVWLGAAGRQLRIHRSKPELNRQIINPMISAQGGTRRRGLVAGWDCSDPAGFRAPEASSPVRFFSECRFRRA